MAIPLSLCDSQKQKNKRNERKIKDPNLRFTLGYDTKRLSSSNSFS